MDADSINLILSQDQNWTSGADYCRNPHMKIHFFLDIIFICYSLPANMIVVIELLKRKYRKRKEQSASSSSSLPEVFLLHISSVNICYCFYLLMILLERLKILQVNLLYIYILYSPGFTSVPLFLVAICVDCYLAVVYPVVYIAAKKLRHQGLLYTTLVWVYAFIIWLINVIYNLPPFHPINMLAFYASLPAVVFFNISTLRVLYSAGPGNTKQTLNPAKRRAFSILLSMLVIMVVYYMPMVLYYTYRFLIPTNTVTFYCTEVPLAMLLPKISKFAAPLIFLYSVGKLNTWGCSFKT